MAILMRHKDSIFGLNTALSQLQTNINAEQTRAIDEEARIEGLLTSEVTRATAAEAALNTSITNEITRATGEEARIEGLLTSETDRATLAESSLNTAITNEVTRATGAEAAINATIASETTRIAGLISAEETARVAADNALDARLDNVEAGLVSGIIPMGSFDNVADLDTLVEANLQHGWGYYIRNTNDLYMYVGENLGAQFDYQPAEWTYGFVKFADYTELSGLVNTEQARATAAEAALNTAITNEVARASAAEADLQSAINSSNTAVSGESARATAAEAALNTAITNEIARASAAEADLQSTKMDKSANLSDLADKAISRTNLDVYSTSETDNAIRLGGAKPMYEVLVVTGGQITLTNAPKDGIFGVMNYQTVRHTDANGVSWDAPLVATADSKVFIVSTDSAGQWNTKEVAVQYLYVPAA